jgi:uncharacterized protein (DUF433 family)
MPFEASFWMADDSDTIPQRSAVFGDLSHRAAVCHTIRLGSHMASLDWSQCPVVESIPGKVSGSWVFRGTRVPVSAIFENLKCSSVDEVLENFHVTREQVQAVLDFAAKSAVPPAEPSRAA